MLRTEVGCARRASRLALFAAHLVGALTLSLPAHAYRPFDGTDADVADPWEVELEIGPVGYLREGRARYLLGPAFVANLGLPWDFEVVGEAKGRFPIGGGAGADDEPTLDDPGVSVKHVLRRGSLQEATGPSIALEVGTLLPTADDPGSGASALVAVSQRWSAVTAHLDVEAAYERDAHWAGFAGLILEGPEDWPARPIAEVYVERESVTTVSGLVGMLWPVSDRVTFDFGARVAHAEEVEGELRAGLTVSFPIVTTEGHEVARAASRRPSAGEELHSVR